MKALYLLPILFVLPLSCESQLVFSLNNTAKTNDSQECSANVLTKYENEDINSSNKNVVIIMGSCSFF